ncbi:DUF4231 domain-containing protein [Mycoplasma iguanae]|uniref:DUF4231 domain-containing protein n=1 Tax=Mycoplasma iguanae TaxID=292461 RepID=A0ABY5R9J9_9MOLU|nr:DUF4231 domain-containing protein [Mycoplasma iguanae]UVD81976.1 DUF4231 domain-containing protein [Mycoplasma iguanae]
MITFKMRNSSQDFVKYAIRSTKLRALRFKTAFWSISIFSLFFGFFSGLMGTAKLASTRFPEAYKSIVEAFVTITKDGKTIDQWPIFVLWIGVATSIISGLLALFLVRQRWIDNEKKHNIIMLEMRLYQAQYGIYSDPKTADLVIFNRVSEILETNKEIIKRWGRNDAK